MSNRLPNEYPFRFSYQWSLKLFNVSKLKITYNKPQLMLSETVFSSLLLFGLSPAFSTPCSRLFMDFIVMMGRARVYQNGMKSCLSAFIPSYTWNVHWNRFSWFFIHFIATAEVIASDIFLYLSKWFLLQFYGPRFQFGFL